MCWSAPKAPCPAEGQLDQRFAACRFSEKSAQDDIREHDIHDHMHEAPKETGRIVHQRVMHIRHTIEKRSRFAPKLGHIIFIYVIWSVEVPDKHGDDGVCSDTEGNGHKGQSPDLDIVAQKDNQGAAHDGNQPDARRANTFGVFDSVWFW